MNNNKNLQQFLILMPPPNVTGQLHMGHALTFWIQDLIVRNQHILGNLNSYLVPGYDHGGIATYKIARKIHKTETIKYEQIAEIAEQHKKIIKEQWEKWKLHINWQYLEYTMGVDHQQLVQQAFIDLYKAGHVYRKEQIIAFDCKFKTAISELEIEHQEQKGKMYTVVYKLKDSQELISVQTTRPETIFADVALAINPEDNRYIHLLNQQVQIPIENRFIPIIADHRVEKNFGTGILKITPAHSLVDWEIGKDHNLPIINIIDGNGLSNLKHHTKYHQMKMASLRSQIVEDLQCKFYTIKQTIPYSSRSGTVIEYLIQDHWFIDMEKLAHKAIAQAPEFIPRAWTTMYENWLKEIRPWCISRTIPWGQKIPAYFNNNGECYVGFEPPHNFKSPNEVFDTWFSSAFWPWLYRCKYNIKIDVLVTGYDIMFFWVARMVMGNLFYTHELPFKKVVIHGLVCDNSGRKMSKTIGNVINPEDLIQRNGYNNTRLALLSGLINNNRKVKFNDTLIHTSKKILTKLKNFRYFTKHYNSNKPAIGQTMENSLYNYINQHIEQYIQAVKNNNIHKQIQTARNTLYNICDWIIELSKGYNIKNVLLFCQDTINNMFYPLLADNIADNTLQTHESDKNAPDFTVLINTIHNIRSYNKRYKDISLITSNKIVEHLCAIKLNHKQKYCINIGNDIVISCSEPLCI